MGRLAPFSVFPLFLYPVYPVAFSYCRRLPARADLNELDEEKRRVEARGGLYPVDVDPLRTLCLHPTNLDLASLPVPLEERDEDRPEAMEKGLCTGCTSASQPVVNALASLEPTRATSGSGSKIGRERRVMGEA